MAAIAAPKVTLQNPLECIALYALLQGAPMYSGVVLMMKLIGSSEIVGERYGAAIFIAIASTFHGLLMRGLAPKFPRFFRHNSAPVFDDPMLSLSEKVSCWLAQPNTALQLLSQVLLLSVLAVGVASIR